MRWVKNKIILLLNQILKEGSLCKKSTVFDEIFEKFQTSRNLTSGRILLHFHGSCSPQAENPGPRSIRPCGWGPPLAPETLCAAKKKKKTTKNPTAARLSPDPTARMDPQPPRPPTPRHRSAYSRLIGRALLYNPLCSPPPPPTYQAVY